MGIDVMTLIVAVLSCGALTALIQVLAARKRNRVDIDQTVVKTVLEIEAVATTRYKDAAQEIADAKSRITYAESKLKEYEKYIDVLKELLQKNGINIPGSP